MMHPMWLSLSPRQYSLLRLSELGSGQTASRLSPLMKANQAIEQSFLAFLLQNLGQLKMPIPFSRPASTAVLFSCISLNCRTQNTSTCNRIGGLLHLLVRGLSAALSRSHSILFVALASAMLTKHISPAPEEDKFRCWLEYAESQDGTLVSSSCQHSRFLIDYKWLFSFLRLPGGFVTPSTPF